MSGDNQRPKAGPVMQQIPMRTPEVRRSFVRWFGPIDRKDYYELHSDIEYGKWGFSYAKESATPRRSDRYEYDYTREWGAFSIEQYMGW